MEPPDVRPGTHWIWEEKTPSGFIVFRTGVIATVVSTDLGPGWSIVRMDASDDTDGEYWSHAFGTIFQPDPEGYADFWEHR